MDFEQPFHVFSAADVRTALPMHKAVPAMKKAFMELSAKEVVVPLRTHMEIPRHSADVLVMSCFSPGLDQVGLKIITLHPTNVERGLPFIQATVMIVDAERGTPLAVMSGATLTAIRTGAGSGAATDVLARKNAKRVGIVGSGVQAETQLEAMCAVRDIKIATVYDVDDECAEAYARRMQDRLGIHVVPAPSVGVALAHADIVCTATSSPKPVFEDADVWPGTHINAIGVYKTHEREVPGPTVARARVVVDEMAAAWAESGELVLARDEGLIDQSHVHAEVGEILSGTKSGRESDDEITMFKSVGNAIQDLSAAHAVLARGTKLGLGSAVSL